ncbi:hypothetical protein BsWGS_25138 [Bradybaena similaris]
MGCGSSKTTACSQQAENDNNSEIFTPEVINEMAYDWFVTNLELVKGDKAAQAEFYEYLKDLASKADNEDQ